MRFGIMLRHLNDHPGGVLVYTRRIVEELLRLDRGHEFVLLYSDPSARGLFGDGARHREEVVRVPTRLLWDQWGAYRAADRLGLDVLFNPKYAVPLASDVPAVWVCHGLDWYTMPWGSPRLQRLVHRHLVPRYAERAAAILSVSHATARDVIRFLDVPPEKVRTVYLGVDDSFRRRPSPEALERVRRQFDLPERFVLFVGHIYPAKNYGRLVRAFARVGPTRGVRLVVAGRHQWLSEHEIELVQELGLEDWVHPLGWVPHERMPPLYHLAEALVLPSLHEGFGLPVLEAMAAGCAVVTAAGHGTGEIVDGAGVKVDPADTEAIAEGLRRVLDDADFRLHLCTVGRRAAVPFTWERAGRETLDVLERVGRGDPVHPSASLDPNGETEGRPADAAARKRRLAV